MLTFFIIRQRFITKIVLIVHQQNCLVLFTIMVEDQMFSSFLRSCIKGYSNVNLLEKQCVIILFIFYVLFPLFSWSYSQNKIVLQIWFLLNLQCSDQITTFFFYLISTKQLMSKQRSWSQRVSQEIFTPPFNTLVTVLLLFGMGSTCVV